MKSRVPVIILENDGRPYVFVVEVDKVKALEQYTTVLEYLAMYATHYDNCHMPQGGPCSCGFVARLRQVEGCRV